MFYERMICDGSEFFCVTSMKGFIVVDGVLIFRCGFNEQKFEGKDNFKDSTLTDRSYIQQINLIIGCL